MTSAPSIISELVERFERNYDSYVSNSYNETQLRREFLDPFFKALGWDVDNEAGLAEKYKDVVHEDSIRVTENEGRKAPDYCFRVGGTRKFFVEAKKPWIALWDAREPAFQLRRYAFSNKLPLSILTNFREFVVYDRRSKPRKDDPPKTDRILYLDYTKYFDEWDKIAGVFSRDAILKGAFDKYAESTKGKKGTAEVDDEILKDIEGWREKLAHNIALRNSNLTVDELNTAVSRTIDRILFLRVCEDRGTEPDDQLKNILKSRGMYARLFDLFRQADERYNSGLFHFGKERGRDEAPDTLTPKLVVDDIPLKGIISSLYYPECAYVWKVIPADILGQVYEQFLGKIIRLTKGHQAKVEDKPEVKKAGGVYYTPTYIVDYIVEHTVGKLLEGKTPKEAAKLRILDPACGSGSFLIGAYQYLLDWYLERYLEQAGITGKPAEAGLQTRPESRARAAKLPIYQVARGGWRLTLAERKRILLDHIYGVDIDGQAVEVTKLSLLLKVLDGETHDTLESELKLRIRALPDLAANIKCGNSLVGTDFYTDHPNLSEDERRRVNPFDWKEEFKEVFKQGGFDAVIGNPPYDVLEKDRGKSSWPHDIFHEYAKGAEFLADALGGKLNLFRFFIVRSIQLCRRGGRFGMIVPLAVLADISCANTRRALFNSASELTCDCFPQKDNPLKRVFMKAKLSTCVITSDIRRESEVATTVKTRVYPANSFHDMAKENALTAEDLVLIDPINCPVPLTDSSAWAVCRRLYKQPMVKRLADTSVWVVNRGEINQTTYSDYITTKSSQARLLKGVEIGRYRVNKELSQGRREWFDRKRFLAQNEEKGNALSERVATQRITGIDERLRVVCTLIQPICYFADSTNSIITARESGYRIEYLMGILNSDLTQWRFKLTSTNNNIGTNEINCLPIRTIDFSDKKDKAHHDKMVSLVEKMLELNKDLPKARTEAEQTRLKRQIAATDKQIDQLVYELYGLTEEEIRIVEGADKA